MPLSREQILKAVDLKRKQISVPQWGGDLLIQEMDGKARAELEKLYAVPEEKRDIRQIMTTMVAMCVVNEQGQHVFTIDDVPALMEKNFNVVSDVYLACNDLSGLGAKAVEEAEKN